MSETTSMRMASVPAAILDKLIAAAEELAASAEHGGRGCIRCRAEFAAAALRGASEPFRPELASPMPMAQPVDEDGVPLHFDETGSIY